MHQDVYEKVIDLTASSHSTSTATCKLDHLVVNHITLGIAHGSIAVPIPDQMRFDAFKIYTDEAYHALFSVDLMRQVEAQTKIRPSFDDEPYFLVRLAALKERHDAVRAQLIEVLFTIVSETLITATLTDLARSQDVASAVVETVCDHALDEGRHRAHFASHLNYLWASLGRKEREFAGRILPELIDIFLLPDFPATSSTPTSSAKPSHAPSDPTASRPERTKLRHESRCRSFEHQLFCAP